jgi:hypothetical protein
LETLYSPPTIEAPKLLCMLNHLLQSHSHLHVSVLQFPSVFLYRSFHIIIVFFRQVSVYSVLSGNFGFFRLGTLFVHGIEESLRRSGDDSGLHRAAAV